MTSRRTLFRSAAVDAQQQRLHGSIVLRSGAATALLTWVFGALALTAVAFLCVAGVTRKETVQGWVMPVGGLARLAAPLGGYVLERRIEEGQPVRAGDVLFVLSGERSTLLGETQQSIGESLAKRIEALDLEGSQQRRQTHDREQLLRGNVEAAQRRLRQFGEEITLQQRRLILSEQTAERYAAMRDAGLISATDADERRADALEQRGRLHALERQRLEAAQQAAEQRADLDDLPLRARREASALERSAEEVRQGLVENESHRTLFVRASRDGRIGALGAGAGQSVQAGQQLAQIEPSDGGLEAELWVPSRAIGFVAPGSTVLLRFAAFPFQTFGHQHGTVREVGHSAMPASDLRDLPLDPDALGHDPLYRVRVRLEHPSMQAFDQTRPLKTGMQLQAILLLEHRRLIEWMFEPLIKTGRSL